MGLLSFARRQKAQLADTPDTCAWEALSGGVLETPGFMMDDDGCEGETAYGADFWMASAAGAVLSVWFYPAPRSAREEDGLVIGRRYEHRIFEDGCCTWTAATYDVVNAEVRYDDLEAADAGARRVADLYARRAFTGHPGHGDGTGFDWDGQPW